MTNLSSSDWGRRFELAASGHSGDEGRAREGLGSSVAAERATALAALVRMRAANSDDVSGALEDGDAQVRVRALRIVAGLKGRPPGDVEILGLLLDADPAVQETAAWACGELEHQAPQTTEMLSQLATEHEDALVREAAVAALGAIGDDLGLPAVLAATRDKATVRRRAVIALAAFDGPDVRDALTTALEDRDWQVRQAAEDQLR